MTNAKELTHEHLLTASRFRVERVTRRLPSGELFSREVVKHPGAVVILPVFEDGRVCLIRNYRIAVEQELLELPAGTREPNEAPIVTAERELIEETGFRCDSIEPLCDFYMSPGILDEHMFAFVARGLTAGPTALETGEEISNHIVTQEQLRQLLCDNQIKDSKSLSVLLYWQLLNNASS